VWLSRLKIANFRSIVSLELDFRHRLTLLIGDNGAGKTTVLDAIAAVLRPDRRSDDDADVLSQGRTVGGVVAGETSIELTIRRATSTLRFGGPAGAVGSGSFGEAAEDWAKPRKVYYGARRDLPNFDQLVDWFAAKDIEEARQIRETSNLRYRQPQLESVRQAVSAMIPRTSNLRIDPATARLVTDEKAGDRVETFEVTQLAGGLRAMLLLVADLAQLLVAQEGNSGTSCPSIVLIDEIDLHLHPRWQLNVVRNLMDAFPQTQFILTTHSEEIIASVPSECVVSLQAEGDGIVARSIPRVQGATFERVLTDAMQVPSPRPPEVQANLDAYWTFVDAGEGESAAAVALRGQLDELFRGTEPELTRADLAIRRNRARRGIGP